MTRLRPAIPRLVNLSVAACGLVVTQAACSDSTPPDRSVVTRPDSTIRLPLDAYLPDEDQRVTIDSAFDLLTRDCMQAAGFDYPLRDLSRSAGLHDRRYGVLDAASASVYGYREWPTERTGFLPAEPASAASAEPSPTSGPSFDLALYGAGHRDNGLPNGCMGAAYDTIGFTGDGDQDFVEGIGAEAWERSRSDRRVAAAAAGWSACMSAAGFHYADPIAAGNDPRFQSPDLSEGEKTVAAASATCNQSVGLARNWQAAESEIQTALIDEHHERLRELAARVAETARRAAAVLKSRAAR